MSDASVATVVGPSKSNETRTRIWMGLIMALVTAGVLFVDRAFAPYYPFLLLFVLSLGLLSALELHQLFSGQARPPLWLMFVTISLVLLANWPAHLGWYANPHPWRDVASAVAVGLLLALLWEMWTYREPGGAMARVGLLFFAVGYLGLLPSFLAQLRWWPASESAEADLRGEAALALAIFVAKSADIGAYFTGKLLGRHKMTPLLSPGKTWEGLAGGMAASAGVAVALNTWVAPVIGETIAEALLFGVVVGMAGVLGDLAESLIKRDCGKKDASRTVPGFGGVLDVVDSVLFAAPVAYWWLRL